MHRMNGHIGYSPNLWIILMMIFIMGLVVIGIVLVVQYLRKDESKKNQLEAKPLEVIQQRLAKGEIDVQEYEQIKETLERDQLN